MFGNAVGSMNIYSQGVNAISPDLLWTMSGGQGNFWHNAKVNLQAGTEFHVSIQKRIWVKVVKDLVTEMQMNV